MSSEGAAGSLQRVPKELLESQNDVQSSPGELHRGFGELENDLKRKNTDIHKTVEKQMDIFDFSKSESKLGAQFCIKGSWHQNLRVWRHLGHRDSTRKTSRKSPRTQKPRSLELAE